MKKSELKKLIRESIKEILKEENVDTSKKYHINVDHFNYFYVIISEKYIPGYDYIVSSTNDPIVFGGWNDEGFDIMYSSNNVQDIYKKMLKDEYFEDWGIEEDELPQNVKQVEKLVKDICLHSCPDCDSDYGYVLMDISKEEIIYGPEENGTILFDMEGDILYDEDNEE